MLQIRQVENLLPVYDNSLLAALGEKATAIYHLQQFVEYLSDSEEERQSIRNGILTKLLELHYLSKQAKCKKRMFRRLSTDFTNLELISKSVKATVYLAQSRHDSSFYCLKVINRAHPQFLDKFSHCLPYLARLNHENLIRYHSCWIELKMKKEEIIPKLYIQLEICDSTPFQEQIEKLNEMQRIKVALSVLQCILYLHNNNLSYGNLKPSNILFSFYGIPKIDPTGATFSPLSKETKKNDVDSLKKIVSSMFEGSSLSYIQKALEDKDELTDIIRYIQSLEQ